MITTHEVTASVQIDVDTTVDLDVKSARITMDDGWSPYIQAELVCALTTETDLELLDPRENLRATVTATKTFDPFNNGTFTDQSRTFDLLLRGRLVDHSAAEMTVTLESDEALLNDYALVATSPERIYGLSVKDAVAYALDKIGATLALGAADADIESDDLPADITNLITNPSFETSIATAYNGGSANTWGTGATGSLTRSSAHARVGDWAARYVWTASATADVVTYFGQAAGSPDPVTAGKNYRDSLWVYVSKAQRMAARVAFKNSADVFISETVGTEIVVPANTWTRLDVVSTAPVGAVAAYLLARVPTSGTGYDRWDAGDELFVDALMRTEGDNLEDYFDGCTTDSAVAEYSWSGSADASTSKRHYLPNSDAMIWQPGVTAWDWLEPLLATVGFHLYCNEDRDWILEAAGAAKSGLVTISSGFNVTDAKDSIDREGEWFDGVVIAYTESVDSAGNTITKFDTAGTSPTKVKTIEFARPYPGAGAAQAVLDRATGRGRVLELEAITDLIATPGMTVSASLPDTPIQVGSVSSVAWSWPEDRMRIGSRGLTDTSPSAWILDEAGVAWSDLATGVDWTEDV